MRGIFYIRHIYMNDGLLADSIEASNALFKQFRIQRQIIQDKRLAKLEITPFAPDFAANNQALGFWHAIHQRYEPWYERVAPRCRAIHFKRNNMDLPFGKTRDIPSRIPEHGPANAIHINEHS